MKENVIHQKLIGRTFTSCVNAHYSENSGCWLCLENKAEKCVTNPGFRCPDKCHGYTKSLFAPGDPEEFRVIALPF